MLDYGVYSEEEVNDMNNNKIEYKKRMGKLFSKSRRNAKLEKCFYCGLDCSSFCNSHSVPKFCLKNIAVNGDVFYSNTLINMPLLDITKGINESGTFQIICRDCDSKIFQQYENPDSYQNEPTPKMLAQIAMKNYLKSIGKRQFEIALFDNMKTDFGIPTDFYEQKQLVNSLDLQEYIDEFKRAKKVDEKGWREEYYLFYYEKLNYVVPLAFQSSVALICDFEGNKINDIYNQSPDYKIQDAHVCIFPMKDHSVIMMFIDSKNKRYRNFYKQFRKLSGPDKLAAINYIVFSYSEDVFIHKGIDERLINDEGLINTSRKSSEGLTTNPMLDPLNCAIENFDLSNRDKIPNLLSEEYKIR